MKKSEVYGKLSGILSEWVRGGECEHDVMGLLWVYAHEALLSFEGLFSKRIGELHPELGAEVEIRKVDYVWPSVVIGVGNISSDWEPCKEIREYIAGFGFRFVVWQFEDGTIIREMGSRVKGGNI